jgi:hypothetical protein
VSRFEKQLSFILLRTFETVRRSPKVGTMITLFSSVQFFLVCFIDGVDDDDSFIANVATGADSVYIRRVTVL